MKRWHIAIALLGCGVLALCVTLTRRIGWLHPVPAAPQKVVREKPRMDLAVIDAQIETENRIPAVVWQRPIFDITAEVKKELRSIGQSENMAGH